MLMTITEALQRANELNREQESQNSTTRYIVLSCPAGSMGCEYQIVARRVGGPASRTRSRR
jgi:hypothetical protein